MQPRKMKIRLKLTWKIWLLIIFLILSVLSIFAGSYLFQKGALVSSVTQNSTASIQGFQVGTLIKSINGQSVSNTEDYSNILTNIFTSNETIKVIFETNQGQIIYYSNIPPQIVVSDVSPTNLKTGLDLSGGASALVQAANQTMTSDQASEVAQMIANRLNVYGLADIQVSPISDLKGNNYVSIEIAGANPSDLESLISQQGNFVAMIGNQTVFQGEKQDIASVATSGQQSGIQSCSQGSGGSYTCQVSFAIYLSQAAAERFALITQNLSIVSNSNGNYFLSKNIDLYLDGQLIDSLNISADLRGDTTTQVSIQGYGTGATQIDAYNSANAQMKKLQTILETGSLPFQLQIVQLNTISPLLGKDFTNTIILAGIIAIFAVSIIIFIRYKKIKLSLALILTSTSEIIIILGIAAFIKWNLDLPSIAGILATIGTGIDSQIIIIDEAKTKILTLKQRLKRAFAIILGSYFTAFVSLIPLGWAAAEHFKGFAFTTIIGITVGILITRPAFVDIVNKIQKE
jgi:preprotein translocase subunit SecD